MKKILFALLTLCSIVLSAQTVNEDNEWLMNRRPEHIYQYSENGVRRLPSRVGSRQTAALTCMGQPKVPVVLVEFADRSFCAAGKTKEEIRHSYDLFFNGEVNEEVEKGTGSRGSVRQYFKDQSLGQFQPVFEILGPVCLDSSYVEYGRNNGSSKDVGIQKFYREALQKILKEEKTDWAMFDNNQNGNVDMVFFIHSGWGENTVSTADPNAIWAKESTSSLTVTVIDSVNTDNADTDNLGPKSDTISVTFGCYAVCSEARVKSNAQLKKDLDDEKYKNGYNVDNLMMDGIGVCIHELSHALGLPDFYDTRNVAFGMDLWSVMDYGEYGMNGYWPGGYNAYERDFMGWQPLEVLSDTTVLNIPCFADGGHGYKIVNEANEDEYYIIENRQAKGWDEKVCGKGHGLQVTHVDYDSHRWNTNSVNTNKDHQYMTIIAANNNYKGTNAASSSAEWNECLAGNLFPYIKPSQSLTNTSVPAAVVYAGQTLNKPLYDITENEDSTVTVYYLKSEQEYQKDIEDVIRKQNPEQMIDVYDMRGMHVLRCLPNELYRISFHHGVYLVKFDDATVKKVLLK